MKAPPAMPASVASAVETKRAESLGALGAWLQQRVIITGNGFDYILHAVQDALRLGAISFDAVKHLLLCHLEGRPPQA